MNLPKPSSPSLSFLICKMGHIKSPEESRGAGYKAGMPAPAASAFIRAELTLPPSGLTLGFLGDRWRLLVRTEAFLPGRWSERLGHQGLTCPSSGHPHGL